MFCLRNSGQFCRKTSIDLRVGSSTNWLGLPQSTQFNTLVGGLLTDSRFAIRETYCLAWNAMLSLTFTLFRIQTKKILKSILIEFITIALCTTFCNLKTKQQYWQFEVETTSSSSVEISRGLRTLSTLKPHCVANIAHVYMISNKLHSFLGSDKISNNTSQDLYYYIRWHTTANIYPYIASFIWNIIACSCINYFWRCVGRKERI